MTREIEFRGIIAGTNDWIYGFPHCVYKGNGIDSIQSKETLLVEYVKSETVGQFTGLSDKNGVKIFEGDKVTRNGIIMEVIFRQDACQFWLVWTDEYGRNRYTPLSGTFGDDTGYFSNDSFEVIGNIHQ